MKILLVATKNEIALQFEEENKKYVRVKKRMKKGRLTDIVSKVLFTNNLLEKLIKANIIR